MAWLDLIKALFAAKPMVRKVLRGTSATSAIIALGLVVQQVRSTDKDEAHAALTQAKADVKTELKKAIDDRYGALREDIQDLRKDVRGLTRAVLGRPEHKEE